ncbi:apolipoprotein acyltransferase [Sedimentitalea sp. JM2-8]|uniref:Apolipoprotein acyltransferase n=1 Tax=Sedimentitalea xiamensis TaxID=3050037 RepID=A0ABT7FDD2_9RHOB|nr:apolipoprotein acyltransferase [Sedimentitalea xiamensis]MDK3073122.1 apolipoprotein acyltransferase [Sedimentitalea xiamensis]
MIVIASVALGAVVGAMTAKRQGGKTADIAQYAAASAMAFGAIGMIATIVIDRLAQ